MLRKLRNLRNSFRVAAATGRREHENVIALSTELAANDPEQVVWLVLMARAQGALGDHESAAVTWRRVLSKEPDNLDALTELTAYYLQQDQPTVACEAIRRALQTQDSTRDLTRLERLFLKLTGRLFGKDIERSADEHRGRRQRWEGRWRTWAEEFLAAHGRNEESPEAVH